MKLNEYLKKFQKQKKVTKASLYFGPLFLLLFVTTVLTLPLINAPVNKNQNITKRNAITTAAFPGAEGYGTQTSGGRGGAICEVTTLNDSGAGSLRDCAENKTGPRMIVFRTGGTINLNSMILFYGEEDSFITIAGQTAPGGGIQLKHYGIAITNTHDVVLRFLKIRPGRDNKNQALDVDAVQIDTPGNGSVYNVVLDHCSLEYGFDETIGIWGSVTNMTVQNSIVANSMLHGQKGKLAKGILIGGDAEYGTQPSRFSFHHNLIANNADRNPRVIYGMLDMRNNIIYNYKGNNSTLLGNNGAWPAGTIVNVNLVNNLWKKGPLTYTGYNNAAWIGDQNVRMYVSGNWAPNCPSGCINNEWDSGFQQEYGSFAPAPETPSRVFTAFNTHAITIQPVSEAVGIILNKAGAIVPSRDALDQQVIDDFNNGTGDLASDAPFYPSLSSGTSPLDTDHDGMPDSWETSHGLNPNDPADRNGDFNNDGYTNVEKYINELAGDMGVP